MPLIDDRGINRGKGPYEVRDKSGHVIGVYETWQEAAQVANDLPEGVI